MRSHLFGMVSTNQSVEYTLHAVLSFLQHTPMIETDLLVVIDNDNSLGDLEAVLEKSPQIEVWKNPEPLSFAENSNNLLIHAMELEADLFLLNNDLIFSDGWLDPLMEEGSTILSSISNRELSYDNPCFNLSVAMSLPEYLGNEHYFSQLVEYHRHRYRGSLSRVTVPFFCVKLPFRAFTRIGAFDTSFGQGGGEDFDYCVRAHLMGVNVAFKLQSYVLHFGGRSTWAGKEQCPERQRAVNKFMRVFQDKWGKKIFDLIFYSSLSTIHEKDIVTDLIHEDNFNSAIKTLLA